MTGNERAFDLPWTLSVRRPWTPGALGAGRRLLALLGRRLAYPRRPRLRLALGPCLPDALSEPSSASSTPELTWFRPFWTFSTPTYLEMDFGSQVFHYRLTTIINDARHSASAADHRQPSGHGPTDRGPHGVSPGSHARALPKPALILATAVGAGSVRRDWRPPAAAHGRGAAPAAMLSLTAATHQTLQSRQFAQPSPPRGGETSSPDLGPGRPPRTSYSAAAGLVFRHRESGADPVTATAADHRLPQAAGKPSALVDALFDQARRQGGLAGLDLRVLPASVAQQAQPTADAPPGTAAYLAAKPPEHATTQTRLSRDAINQVADQVASVLRQRERIERERKGGYPWR